MMMGVEVVAPPYTVTAASLYRRVETRTSLNQRFVRVNCRLAEVHMAGILPLFSPMCCSSALKALQPIPASTCHLSRPPPSCGHAQLLWLLWAGCTTRPPYETVIVRARVGASWCD